MTDVSVDMTGITASTQDTNIVIKFKLNTAISANTGVLRMEFPTSLTLNAGKTLPVCEYDANGSGWQTASNCGIDNVDNTLELQLAGHNMDTGVEHKVRFRGYDYNVYAANVADVFEFCLSTKTNILSTC